MVVPQLLPGPRGRLYAVSPHFAERWESRTLLSPQDISGAVRTARVFARAPRTGVELLWASHERRVLVAKLATEGGFWVLLTVLYPPAPELRPLHRPGSRAWAFWRLMAKERAADTTAHTGG